MMQESIHEQPKIKFKWSMLAMVLFGIGEIIGCFFIGTIVDKLGSKVAQICNIVLILLMTGFTIAFVL